MTGQRGALLIQLSLMTIDKDDVNNDNLNDEDDDDVIVEHSFVDAHASLPADCPFTLPIL